MALTALHESLRLTEITVALSEETGLFTLVYNGEVAVGFDTVPVTSNAQGLSLAEVGTESFHSSLIGDLNDAADEALGL